MQIVPTLNFAGGCREAIHMYEKAFEGKINCLITYGEANDPAYMPLLTEAQKDWVYHAELALGDKRIIMSDQVLICKGGIYPPIHHDCGSFVVNGCGYEERSSILPVTVD